MKQFIVLLISIFSVAYGMAQKWVLDSSVWKIYETWFGVAGMSTHYFEITVLGDTTVLGETCKKLSNGIITFERNDTVFVLYDGNFHSVLYFSAQIGDTIPIFDYHGKATWHITPDESSDTVWAKVSAIDSVYTGNKYLKNFYFDVISPSSIITESFINYGYTENMGGGYIFPYFYYDFIYDQPSIGTCDYGDSSIQDFWFFDRECTTVSVNDIELKEMIAVFPNPSSSSINIRVEHDEIQQISIYNLHGQIQQTNSYSSHPKEVQVGLADFLSGIYFLHLQLSNGRNYVKRIIKQ